MMLQDYDTISATLGRTSSPALIQGIARQVELGKMARILDLGCGSGGNAEHLRRSSGAEVFGIDISASMLGLVPLGIHRIRGDVLDLPFANEVADAAIAINVLQLLESRDRFFHEVARVLVPHGLLILPFTGRVARGRRFLNRFFPSLPAREAQRYPSWGDLQREAGAARLELVRVLRVNLGGFRIDEAYLRRIQAGAFSGVLALSEAERECGLRELASLVHAGRADPEVHPWRRAVLVFRRVLP